MFCNNRDIHDNILIRHEILSTFHQKRKKKVLYGYKIGYENAYDRLECESFLSVFRISESLINGLFGPNSALL